MSQLIMKILTDKKVRNNKGLTKLALSSGVNMLQWGIV